MVSAKPQRDLLVSRVKRHTVDVLSTGLRREGFSPYAARLWRRLEIRDFQASNGVNFLDKSRLHAQGYTSEGVDAADLDSDSISQRDFLFLRPFNRRWVWTSNRVVATRVIPGLADHTPARYCTAFYSGTDFDVIRLHDFPAHLSADEEGLLSLIRELGAIDVLPIQWDRGVGRTICFNDGDYYVDGWPASEEDVVRTLGKMSSSRRNVFTEHNTAVFELGEQWNATDGVVRFFIGKEPDNRARVLGAALLLNDSWRPVQPNGEQIAIAYSEGALRRGWSHRRTRYSLGEKRYERILPIDMNSGSVMTDGEASQGELPSLLGVATSLEEMFSGDGKSFTFISVDVGIDQSGRFTILDLSATPRYLEEVRLDAEEGTFLKGLINEKEVSIRLAKEQPNRKIRSLQRKTRRTRRRISTFQLRAEGFSGRMARSWVSRVDRSKRRKTNAQQGELNTAYSWGFMPSIVDRFGINESNRHDLISERDYAFVLPLNGKYSKWIRDRVSALTIFGPYSRLLEPTHYHFILQDGDVRIIPLSDQAKVFEPSVRGLADFLKASPDDRTQALTSEDNEFTADSSRVFRIASSAYTGSICLELSYSNDQFLVDGRAYSHDEFHRLLRRRVQEQFYVLLDPVQQDTDLSGKFPNASSEIRVVMMNPDGVSPTVAEASAVITEEIDHQDVLEKAELYKPNKRRAPGRKRRSDLAEGESEQAVEDSVERAEHSTESVDDVREELDDQIEEYSTPELQNQSGEVRQTWFFSQIDKADGSYAGARAIIDGLLYVFESDPVSGQEFSGSVRGWREICDELVGMCRFAPQLEFVEFRLVVTDEGPVITKMSAFPSYGRVYMFSPETTRFLKDRVERKNEISSDTPARVTKWLHNAKLWIRKRFAKTFYPKGLVPYQSVRWIGDICRDLREPNGIPLRTKFWAYRHGFLSYRLPQYGITEENWESFISDFEYRWLRHINVKYKYWLEDKISIKYVASKFKESFPQYYYFTSPSSGKNTVVPMMDCPEGYEATYEEILRLAREIGTLALKPDEGSHGDGFYRLDYSEGGYLLNGEHASEDDVLGILSNPDNQYLITEFIYMHPDLAQIYPYAVNTLRVIVFKKDGVHPQIGNAYFRIGTSESGFVDNTAAGGMFARVNVETGHFGDAQVLKDGLVRPQPRHPDTGLLIEGTLPHWEYAKQQILSIASSIEQLEYLGFDVAITADGIKLPEINRFPDYPRIEKLTPETINYLLGKVEQKKKATGYEYSRLRLVNLPQRKETQS